MTDTTTRPVLWSERADHDIDDVHLAIERWHVEHDIACPPDEQFRYAIHLVPRDTSIGADPDTMLAQRMRVVMPCGSVYAVDVEYDADLRGDDWRQQVRFIVRSAEVVQ